MLNDSTTRPKTYVTTNRSLPAEQELLALLVPWLLEHYSDRFAVADGAVQTLTEGYRRRFVLAEWADRPLVLAGLLVQEDWYLLAEEEVETPPARMMPQGHNLADGFEYEASDHSEDHPSGRQHVFLSACSCFSFSAVNKHMKTMGAIHHPNVPGWYYSLQRGMNRLFAQLTPEVAWYRHNFGFSLDYHKISGLFTPEPKAVPERQRKEDAQEKKEQQKKKGMWQQVE